MHLIDIENLVDGRPSTTNLHTAWSAYQREITTRPGDQVWIACAKSIAARVAFTITDGRVLISPNTPNGADHTLIDWVDLDFTANRFDAVVIASGDHAFTPLTAALAGHGCPVTIAHRPGTCAATLQLAATTTCRLHYRLQPR